MKVSIKDLAVKMELGNNGVEFEVKAEDGSHLGDLVVKKKGLIWCRGRTRREQGVPVSWREFIAWMESDG